MPTYFVGNHGFPFSPSPKDVLGSGGEGTVFRAKIPGGYAAIKIYHEYKTGRADKLSRMQKIPFPPEVVAPLDLIRDEKSRVAGFLMKLLPSGQQVLETLMGRKQRDLQNITTLNVMELFVPFHKILQSLHDQNVIAGDLNPLNELFKGKEISIIDADSFQVDKFPCAVATEKYLTPRLYGVNLSLRPVFEKEDDWYSYMVLLFQSLLLVHPYGGAHKTIKTIPKRTLAKVTVLHPDVIYPEVAYPPEIINDELLEKFDSLFSKGRLTIPSVTDLEKYQAELLTCRSCGTNFPNTRKNCPQCAAANKQAQATIRISSGDITTTELFKTNGPIVFARLQKNTLFVIANEQGDAVLYMKGAMTAVQKFRIFKALPGAKYEIFDNKLVVCPEPQSEIPNLYIFAITKGRVTPLTQTVTSKFGDRSAVFRGSENHLYRVIGGILQRGSIPQEADLVEDVLATTLENQCWFDVATIEDTDVIFGFNRIVDKYEWFLHERGVYRFIKISELERGEAQIDKSIRFGSASVLLLRKTRKGGEDYCRIETVDRGEAKVTSSRRVSLVDHLEFENIHGQAYARGTVLIPTDAGLIAENAQSGSQRLFSGSAGIVNQESQIWQYDRGLLAITGNRVLKLAL